MGDTTYWANLESIEETRKYIMGSAGQIRNELDTMDANLQKYLQYWDGEDYKAYLAYWKQWGNTITDINDNTLPKAANALNEMSLNMSITERKNMMMF
jgi:uncharacterized protein YukE